MRSKAKTFDDIRGTVHAFCDPDTTSGYLVTCWMLALRQSTPAGFFQNVFFTYSHRNTIRAVANGLAESGSVEGYVWDIMKEREPSLVEQTRIVYRSDPLGFPPIVAPQTSRNLLATLRLTATLLDMPSDGIGRELVSMLGLDGFTTVDPGLYNGTAEKWHVVKAQM
jgi:ABC-type phosphate/phosphonate transport system substrate-binding protein